MTTDMRHTAHNITWLATSDLHGSRPDIPACDVLLIGGDVCPTHDHSLDYQRKYLDGPFRHWLECLEAQHVVWIGGNHDYILDTDEGDELARTLRGTYLRDESTVIDGLTIHGTPWTPLFGDWAFMRPDDELAEKWALIPEHTDVLLSHGPARGILDQTVGWGSVGSVSLRERLDALPTIQRVVCGHIHEAAGVTGKYLNVSHVNVNYVPRNDAVEIWSSAYVD